MGAASPPLPSFAKEGCSLHPLRNTSQFDFVHRILKPMADLLSAVLGLSFASGLNAYATVLGLGVMHRLGVFHLPHGLEVIATTPVITAAAVLYIVEFVADKIPFIDTLWDGIHTVIRPAAGALLAYGAVGNLDLRLGCCGAPWRQYCFNLSHGQSVHACCRQCESRTVQQLGLEPGRGRPLISSCLVNGFASIDRASDRIDAGDGGNLHCLDAFSLGPACFPPGPLSVATK